MLSWDIIFLDLTIRKFQKILEVNRSTIQRRRHAGLEFIKKFMEEEAWQAKHPMIPFPVIVRAADGDIEAVNQIVRHYSGFIASRSMRPMKDEYGNTHMVVDETLRRRMETRLIAKILSFEIREPN